MTIRNDDECRKLIQSLDRGLPPEIIDEMITYLDNTNNSEFTIKLIKYLNAQNIQSRHSLWALGSQIAMIGEDVDEIKRHLGI